jgi:hypothetical protein
VILYASVPVMAKTSSTENAETALDLAPRAQRGEAATRKDTVSACRAVRVWRSRDKGATLEGTFTDLF